MLLALGFFVFAFVMRQSFEQFAVLLFIHDRNAGRAVCLEFLQTLFQLAQQNHAQQTLDAGANLVATVLIGELLDFLTIEEKEGRHVRRNEPLIQQFRKAVGGKRPAPDSVADFVDDDLVLTRPIARPAEEPLAGDFKTLGLRLIDLDLDPHRVPAGADCRAVQGALDELPVAHVVLQAGAAEVLDRLFAVQAEIESFQNRGLAVPVHSAYQHDVPACMRLGEFECLVLIALEVEQFDLCNPHGVVILSVHAAESFFDARVHVACPLFSRTLALYTDQVLKDVHRDAMLHA